MTEKMLHPRSGSKVMERGRASPAADVIMPLLSSVASDSDHAESVDETVSQTETVLLKESATQQEIVDAMKHPTHGLGFLSPHASLPGHAFVSADAVSWLKTHMENEPNQERAVAILEDMRKERFICHASGDFSHPFIVGFYLYHIVNQDKDNKDEPQPLGDLQSFENEWLEVEVKPPQPHPPLPVFLCDTLQSTCSEWTGPMYKHTHLEIDVQGKSDRVEWGHVKYQSVYSPDRAYEIVVQWMAASGTIVSELVTGWARKAQASSGLLMIPIPADPFALPFSIKSDSLRGPVFIPLDTECLMGTNSYLFEEFPEETRAQRLVLFQEAIAIRFGFIACVQESGNQHQHNQYIHLTGNVFLMIPTPPCDKKVSRIRDTSVSRSRSIWRYPTYNEVVGTSPHQEYITRHVNIQKKGCDNRIGFLWSWNHMISRRWKWCSSAKSDEAFQNKLLSDFRQFCANADNRLKTFWDASWAQRKQLQS